MKKVPPVKKIKKVSKSINQKNIKRKAFLFSEEAEWLWDNLDEKARIMSADFRQVTSARGHDRK